MKTRLLLPLAATLLFATSAARADMFGTAVGGGVGAVAGAVIGDSMGGRNGAIIGSGVGGAVGAVVGQQVSQGPSYPRPRVYYPAPRFAMFRPPCRVSLLGTRPGHAWGHAKHERRHQHDHHHGYHH